MLANDIDASGTAAWNNGAGFVPIGGYYGFLGLFDGQGHAIANLKIGTNVGSNRGLFSAIGYDGTIQNLKLSNAHVSADSSYTSIGILAGTNNGTIDNVIVSGIVQAGNYSNVTAGGLVGENNGDVRNSLAAVAVTAGPNAYGGFYGGLVGYNGYRYNITNYEQILATVSDSVSTGSVSGATGSDVGGAVGLNLGEVERVAASGSVSTTGVGGTAGGLIGFNEGSVLQSFATGAVFGDDGTAIGGLIGANVPNFYNGGASVLQSYATGSVTGTGTVIAGGLIGINGGDVTETYSTGRVTIGADGIAGGLIAVNEVLVYGDGPSQLFIGDVESSYWNTQTSGQSTSAPNAGVGLTTAQLTQGLPAGFDPDVWQTVPGQSYPYLFGPPPYVPSDPAIYDPGQLVNQVSLTPGNTGFGPPSTDQSNVTPPPAVTESGGNGGGQGGGQGGGGQGGNPGAGPPPGPGLDRSLSEQRFSGVPPLNETRFVPNEIVLQIPASVTREQVDAIAKELGVEIVAAETIGLTGRTLYRFRLKPGQDIRALIRRLEQNRIVSSAQPNYVYGLAQGAQPAPAPTAGAGAAPEAPTAGGPEPAASGTSDLASDLAARTTLPTGDPAQYVIQKLHLGTLHQRVRGANVTVAVIDSEIDLRHPDLQGVAAERFDATGSPSRPHTHGTGMAGAIASRYRLLGVAPGVRLLAVRAFSETDKSAEATTTQVLKGLDWAIARNPRIINMSFAGPRDLMTERLLEAAARKGIVLIAAAGNAGPKSPPLYPAADPNVIAVSATDTDDKPFVQANRGKHIAVAAPGVDVLVPSPGGGYQLTTGTSVAAAHVSGIAALLIEARPSLTPADVRSLLTRTAKPLGPGRDVQVGAGLVDPVRSLGGIMPATAAPAPIRPGVMPAMPLR